MRRLRKVSTAFEITDRDVKHRGARAIIIVMILLVWGVPVPASASEIPPQDVASYTIDARYDPETYTLTAEETAVYVNRTQTPIPDLVFHLYLNAFRSADTQWMQEAGPSHRGNAFSSDHPGSMAVEDLRLADGTPLTLEAVDPDETLVRAPLPTPVAPGEAVTVTMRFTARFPRVFARTGWAKDGDFIMAGQWFPKFGVWEEGAWDAYPFHANSEFYADFGAYDVAVTLPESWMLAGTSTVPIERHPNDDGTVTYRMVSDHVIDVAWAASPDFRERTTTVGDVTIRVVYDADRRTDAARALKAAAAALPHYEAWYGSYGRGLYPQLTVVVVPADGGGAGGMEYPTLFTVGQMAAAGPRCVRMLEVETVHELGHQWFQAMVATNEAEEPWLDEGLTDYSTARAMHALYDGAAFDCGGWSLTYREMQRMSYLMNPDIPMAGKAWSFEQGYAIATYSKPVVALSTLQRRVGDEAMVEFLRAYVDRYAFAHPTAGDLRAVMVETLGEGEAAWFFDEVAAGGRTVNARIEALSAENALLIREGELCLPTVVKVTDDGAVRMIDWPCDRSERTLTPAPDAIEIDPQHVNLLDENLADNGLRRRPDGWAWLGMVARLVRTLQSFYRGGGL
jgi:hypothetical protein